MQTNVLGFVRIVSVRQRLGFVKRAVRSLSSILFVLWPWLLNNASLPELPRYPLNSLSSPARVQWSHDNKVRFWCLLYLFTNCMLIYFELKLLLLWRWWRKRERERRATFGLGEGGEIGLVALRKLAGGDAVDDFFELPGTLYLLAILRVLWWYWLKTSS